MQLKPLKGAWLKAYTAIWLALAAILYPLAIYSEANRYSDVDQPNMIEVGISVRVSDAGDGLSVYQVGTDEAVAQGIRQNDIITAVNHTNLAGLSYGEMIEALDRTPQGGTVTLEFKSVDGVSKSARLIRSKANALIMSSGIFTLPTYFILRTTTIFMAQIAFMVVAILMFRRRQEVVPQILAAGFLSVTLFPVVNLLGDYLPAFVASLRDSLLQTLILLGLLVFPKGRIRGRASIFIAALIIISGTFTGMTELMGWPGWLEMIGLAGFLIVAFEIGINYRRERDPASRQQYRWVFLGFSVVAVGLILAEIVSQMGYFIAGAFPGSELNWVSGILYILYLVLAFGAPVAMPIGLLIALLRYRLYDADVVLGRTTTYVLTTLFLGIGFFVAERTINFAGRAYLGEDLGGLSYGLAAALAAVSLGPIHSAMVRWSDRRFQKKLMSLRDDLPETARDMRHTASLDDLLGTALERIVPAVYAKGAAILDSDGRTVLKTKELDTQTVADWAENWEPTSGPKGYSIAKDDPLFSFRMPLNVNDGANEVVGWLLVTPRYDGSLVNRDERVVLEGLSDPLARAKTIIGERRAEKAAIIALLDSKVQALSDELSKVQAKLAETVRSQRIERFQMRRRPKSKGII